MTDNNKEITQKIKDFIVKINNAQLFDESHGQLLLGKDADYDFRFSFESWYEQFEINAVLREGYDKNIARYFWGMPFEFVAYSNDINKVAKHFMEVIEILSKYPTKIIQRKGILFYSFSLLYFKENSWQRLFGHSCFRYSNFIVPNREEREIIYYSNKTS